MTGQVFYLTWETEMRSGRGSDVPVGGAVWRLGNLPRRVGLLLTSVIWGAAAAVQPLPAPDVADGAGPQAGYRVINLGPGSIAAYPHINATGQVAFCYQKRAQTCAAYSSCPEPSC